MVEVDCREFIIIPRAARHAPRGFSYRQKKEYPQRLPFRQKKEYPQRLPFR